MELKVWVKTFFSIYRWLDKLAKAVDDYVSLRGVSCYYKNLRSITLCSTEKVAHDITGLMNKKINLINIKVLCDKLLCALPENLARFVVAKYIDNHTFEKVSEILQVNIRTTMRWNVVVFEKCKILLHHSVRCRRFHFMPNGMLTTAGKVVAALFSVPAVYCM